LPAKGKLDSILGYDSLAGASGSADDYTVSLREMLDCRKLKIIKLERKKLREIN
jgi:hypothetical protein